MDPKIVVCILVLFVLECASLGPKSRTGRQMAGLNRKLCTRTGESPGSRTDTTERIRSLRNLMGDVRAIRGQTLSAYIVTTEDEHQSEYVSDHDKRREYITGFRGSSGDAVITRDAAALWTDGRYFLQADDELDCNWLLMKIGQKDVPTMTEWLISQLRSGSRVGADPHLIPSHRWIKWKAELDAANISLVEVDRNLIDEFWTSNRPQPGTVPAFPLDIKFAGRSWEDKVADLRAKLEELGANATVVTALDEVAWLLNIRGRDIPYNPVVRGYVIVSQDEVILYTTNHKLNPQAQAQLKTSSCYSANCTRLRRYPAVFDDLKTFASTKWNKILVPAPFTYSQGVSQAIYSAVPDGKRLSLPSPVMFMKAKKNAVEIKGMRKAHIRDAAAICNFLSLLESEVAEGKYWDELSVADRLDWARKEQKWSQGISFTTIAGFGPNGALPHYQPSPETNRTVDDSSTLVLDSGGQYYDGTTDVTRTFHFGTPTDFQREAYTRVLMGSIQLASLVFPDKADTADVDVMARAPLWNIGLDYRHGTGHGIGAFLNVHESPISVSYNAHNKKRFEEGYFLSDEPGYYQDGDFGIRLENIIEVVKADTKYHFDGPYFKFQPVTLVPYEPKLIKVELLSHNQRRWLNNYNSLIRTEVGAELKKQQKLKGFYWMMSKTGYVSGSDCSRSSTTNLNSVICFAIVLFRLFREFRSQDIS